MRPIRLEIEGLQSFAEKQVIDFKTLTEHGLFGIFGKTGSGKSTILDAITLAIYGDVVRLENSVDDKLIDLLNTNSDKIEIKFVFILGEQEYTIYRKFPKMKKKLEFGSKKVLMYCGDEIIAEKNSEIKSKVEELIGLSMGDFTRSVVLPQGKFSEFLKLTGTDKRDMLERIFGLEKYGKKLTAKLRYEKSIKQKEIEAIKNQIQGKGDLDPKKIEELKEKLKELLQKRDEFDLKNTEFNKKYKDKEEVKDLLEEFEKHNEKKLKLEGNIKNIEELKINIENNIAAQNIIVLNKNKKTVVEKIKVDEKTKIDLLENLEKLKIEVKKVTIELEDLKKKEEVILKKSIELEVDPNKREVLNKVITIKKDIEKVVKKLKGTTNIQEETIEALREEEKNYKVILENIDQNKTKINKINKVEIIDTTVLLLKNENIKNEVKEIKKLEIEKKEIEKKIEVEKSEKLKLSDEKLKLEGIILVEEEKIKNDLAYQLAKDLSEDSNCPVCGSKDHPKLANPSIEIDETLLLSLKETLEKVNSKYHKLDPQKLEEELSIKVENLNTRNSIELEKVINKNTVEIDEIIGKNRSCEELKNNLEQEKNNLDLNRVKLEGILKNLKEKSVESEEVLKDENSKKLELEEGLKLLYVDFSNLDLELNELEEKYKVLKNQEVESKLYREESKEYRKKYEDKGSQKQKVDDNLNKVKTELVEVETTLILNGKINEEKKIELLNMVENSKFSNLEVAIESSLSPENVIKYEKEIKTHSNESIKNNGLIESLKIKINNRTISSNEWEELKVEKNEMKELDGRLTRDMTSTKKDIDRMEELLKDVEDLLIESREKEVDYHLLEDMNKLFAGNAFVEYLALGKLKNITKHASKRLEKITNGRYGIGVGGDANFVICDNFNGGIKRRAATLSGGETFLVSLSLALALSNQIQLKGKVNLEFFFLDEGFGTLDSSLLDKVISSLETLKDDEKLKVGIITHVEELKERVPRKLEVLEAIPGERGSKVVMN